MNETASPTVFRFWTSLSGILTPNFSSAATTTSTMESESTSRSSVKDFASVTSSGLTPATSSRMAARPWVTSSRLLMYGFPLVSSCVSLWWRGCAGGLLRAADNLSGVREATAEAEEQDRGARGHLTALDQLRQGQRDTRR